MTSFEELILTATNAKAVPGVVVVGSNAEGDSYYAKPFGFHSLKDGFTEPLNKDSVFWLASATKIMAAIAALQCVERGQFTLDEDATRLLTELKDIDILTGFEEGTDKPILTKAKKTVTLRTLLTHTSGLGYDAFNPMLLKWRQFRGEETSLDAGTLVWRCTTPLLFEPGESYEYSTGLDWAGQMVERANNMTLQAYMEKYIWAPLGIKTMTFHPDKSPDILQHLAEMGERQGGVNVFGGPENPSGPMAWSLNKSWNVETQSDDSGGAGAFGSAIDFQKVLQSLTTDDGKLLSSATLNEIFKPQLSPGAQARFQELNGIKEITDISASGIPAGTKVSHGLGGLILLEDLQGRRRKGTLSWQGLPNFYWWVDRESGVNGVYGNQVIPCGDPQSLSLFVEFEKDVYKRAQINV